LQERPTASTGRSRDSSPRAKPSAPVRHCGSSRPGSASTPRRTSHPTKVSKRTAGSRGR